MVTFYFFLIGNNFFFTKIQLNIIKCTNKELFIIELLFDRLKRLKNFDSFVQDLFPLLQVPEQDSIK